MLSSYNRNDLTLARVGEPLVRVDVDGGMSQVIDRAGTDEFIVVPNAWNPDSPEVLRLGSDARTAVVSTGPLARFSPWQIQFLRATGQMVVNDSGGVYAVNDDGSATRISTGDLIIMGSNHYIVRECDEALTCSYIRVDQATGQRDQVALDVLDRYRQWGDFSSSSLSPDGTALSYFDWMNAGASPARRMIDLATGADAEVSPADQYNNEPAWAADSSGLFVLVGRTPTFYDRATGALIPVAPDAELDDIVALAARPVTG